ncbi:aminotransferase class IV [Rudaeicoccus suwonensis]|uniref:Branched-chain amino acid aminotransferase n=1 Tax=Rudaeicoccus suwonensis TaxID=657409 RepID=A0A561EBB7_9MICO|nr:aminotransferase class IV [Rudaeicoccus suwonensis]TWE12913.1 branched-chain amino acid aminotransferase [Rudaeicoccus suwonensis]
MNTRVWVDGERVDDKPSVRALDHGVTVGDGVFETCKIDGGEVFVLERHYDRLDNSLRGLGLQAADRAHLDEGIAAVLREPMDFGRLRFTVTGGLGPLGSDRSDVPMTYIVSAVELERPQGSTKIVVVPWTRNENSAVAGLKTTSYAENVVALAHAKSQGGSEAIFANTRGELCEGTGSNIFVVVDGEILTPPLSAGPLAGITRALVLEWCGEAGIAIREQTLPLDVLRSADEVFITSSTRDVQPVHAVDDRVLPAPGPLTTAAADVFAKAAAAGRR